MALEDIINKIKEDAAAEISRIKADTDKEVDSIISECEEECRGILDEAARDGERQAADARNRMKIEANLDGKKDLLAGRRDLLEQVFSRVSTEIRKDEKKYLEFLVQKIADSAGSGNEKVIFSKSDVDTLGEKLQTVVSDANKILYENSRKGELVIAPEGGDFQAGFILKKGRTNTVMTMETMLQGLRDEIESSVAQILTGEKA